MIGKRDVHPNINIGSDNVDKASTYDVQDHDVQDHLKVLFQKNHLPSNLFEPSIPYRKPKEHPLYARTFPFYCVRAYRPCTDVRSDWSETRNIGETQSKRQDTIAMVIPCLCSFTVPSSPSAEPLINKKRTRTLSHRESGSSTNCLVDGTGLEPVTSCTSSRCSTS